MFVCSLFVCSRRARLRRNVAACALLTTLGYVDEALAGHAPLVPEPRVILLQNGHSEHVVVGARRGGYFVTADAGVTWSWLCEAGVGYDDEDVYPGALLPSGTLVVSTGFGGVASSRDGCAFSQWLPNEQTFVADIRVRPDQPSTVLALEARADGASFFNQLWESTDDAASWQRLGPAFAAEERATSFAVAADGSIFVGTTDTAGAALWRLDSKASRVERVPLTDEAGASPRLIGASGAGDTARVYLVLDYAQVEGLTTQGDVALFSVDGARTFEPLLASTGDLPAGALSADGKTLALGGEDDGVQLLEAADIAVDAKLVKVSALEAHALAWDSDGRLYAAGHESEDGFAVGVSTDGGRTFESLLALCQVQGPANCPADTSVGSQCLARGETGWDVRKEVADSHACDTTSGGAANEASSEPGAIATSGASATPGATAMPGAATSSDAASGCSFVRSPGRAAVPGLCLLLAGLFRRRRRAQRSSRH